MEKLQVLSYEVYVLSKDGWTLHARYPGEEQKEALTEAKAAEARLAAATKVIRSEYNPRSNEEVRKEIYSSRMTAAEATTKLPAPPPRDTPRPAATAIEPRQAKPQQSSPKPQPSPTKPQSSKPKPKPAPPKAKGGRARTAYSPGSVVLHILIIVGSAGLMAGLITMTAGAIFGDSLPFIGQISFDRRRTLLSGLFVATFLLMAVPWMVALARRIGDIDFGGHDDARSKASLPKAKASRGEEPHQVADTVPAPLPETSEPAALAPVVEGDVEPPPPAPPEPLAIDEQAEAAGDAPAAEDAPVDDDEEESGATPESRKRAEVMRRSLIRFLGGLVNGLQQTRPPLDGYERFGLGLLITGAAGALAESTGVGPKGFDRLLREALGVLGSRASVEVLLEEINSQANEPRGQRMIEAGRVAVLQFLRGSRDYMVAVLAALEQWNRPTGATGAGVVATLVAEAWPFDDRAEEAAREVAHTCGGAVLGIADGLVMLFPGAARAVEAALELLPRLPAAARIGVDAIEATGEEEALQSVGSARVACESAAPGQVLVTGVVRGLCSRLPASFVEAPAAADGTPLFAVTAIAPATDTAEASVDTEAVE